MIVLEQDAGLGVHGDVYVGPAVVIEVVAYRSNRKPRSRLENAGFFRYICERAITIVVVEDVGIARKAAGSAHGRHALPLAETRLVHRRRLVGIEFHKVTNE